LALAFTLFPGVSKLHLLWAGPVLFVLPMMLMGWLVRFRIGRLTGRSSRRHPTMGRDIPLDRVVRQVMRVVEFDRSDTIIGPDDKVIARSEWRPYGYLIVESPVLPKLSRLPVFHRDDFWLASSVLDLESWNGAEQFSEFLVTYAPEIVIEGGLSGGITHTMHFVVAPSGTLEDFYEEPEDVRQINLEKLFGVFVYEGAVKVQATLGLR
jgi:hypothetical protein